MLIMIIAIMIIAMLIQCMTRPKSEQEQFQAFLDQFLHRFPDIFQTVSEAEDDIDDVYRLEGVSGSAPSP